MSLNKTIIVIVIAALVMQSKSSMPDNSDNCLCTREYNPICASDGITYSNKCLFECEKKQKRNLEIREHGTCDEASISPVKESACVCTLNISPVCGSDGKTYPNKCSLNCAQRELRGLTLKHQGKCSKDLPINNEVIEMDSVIEQCACPLILSPVCGSDEKTYSNQCEFDCEKKITRNLKIKHNGECEKAAHM
ncbi:serine protease inhibitor dipetalogastin-like [Contarinia nasturtii]|uniref:serine protease inhibitor dipetalogastin-like n=1 Tax=Contarinia nasturtii TaxID=265458 RepID=UPI0012D3D479|nr:serine protease inhibitor dipetalogastin-like [Contarinia nasturtii]